MCMLCAKTTLTPTGRDVQKFVHAVLRSQEALTELLANKSSQQAKYRQLLVKSADLLLGAPQATADVEGMLGDCEFVFHTGNVAFFTGVGTTRTLTTLDGGDSAGIYRYGADDQARQPASLRAGTTTSSAAGLKNTRADRRAKI